MALETIWCRGEQSRSQCPADHSRNRKAGATTLPEIADALNARGVFGSAPTRRGTIFIFRSKFLSYRGMGRPARPRMNNFLPGKTSYAPQWSCRAQT